MAELWMDAVLAFLAAAGLVTTARALGQLFWRGLPTVCLPCEPRTAEELFVLRQQAGLLRREGLRLQLDVRGGAPDDEGRAAALLAQDEDSIGPCRK